MKREYMQTTLIVVLCVVVIFFLLYIAINLLSNSNYYGNDDYPSEYSSEYPKAAEIIDGDTFRTADGEVIRLLCVNTPEKNQEGYDEATDFLAERLFYSDIRLEGNETDRYGRSLRWVYVDDVLINKEIIDLGYGTLYEYDGEDCEMVE